MGSMDDLKPPGQWGLSSRTILMRPEHNGCKADVSRFGRLGRRVGSWTFPRVRMHLELQYEISVSTINTAAPVPCFRRVFGCKAVL